MAVAAALGYAVLRRGLVVVALAATAVTVAAWAATPHPATTGTGSGPLQATINALRQERLFSCAWSAWSLHVKHTGRTLRYNSEVGVADWRSLPCGSVTDGGQLWTSTDPAAAISARSRRVLAASNTASARSKISSAC